MVSSLQHFVGGWPLSGVITSWLAVLATIVATVLYLSSRKIHPQEPPVIISALPFVGHLLGMALQGGRYIKSIGIANRDKPIFTLPVPWSRIYVVTDPPLAAAVQRASKALSFTPLVPDITKRVLGLDAATVSVIRQNLDPEPGEERGFLAEMHDMLYRDLGPGDALDRLTYDAAVDMSRQVNAHIAERASHPNPIPVDLLEWVRHFVTMGTAHFLYGPENPLVTHPELEQAFWDFDHGLGMLLMGVAPSITAAAAYRSREALVAAFVEYLSAGRHLPRPDGSGGCCDLVRKRIAIADSYGWPVTSTARSELSFLFAGIVNAATTTFWMVLQIFARPELLATVRAELAQIEGPPRQDGEKGGQGERPGEREQERRPERMLSLERIRGECPVLYGVYRECLRTGSNNFSTRLVKSDTLLADRYFLRAGSVVQIAGGVIHADRDIWGDDVDTFNPSRFLPAKDTAAAAAAAAGSPMPTRAPHPAAFRSFGGGKTLCPGRHFATGEILSLAAMIVLSFDLGPPGGGGGGTIPIPPPDDRVLPVHILEPSTADTVHVVVGLRGGQHPLPVRIVP